MNQIAVDQVAASHPLLFPLSAAAETDRGLCIAVVHALHGLIDSSCSTQDRRTYQATIDQLKHNDQQCIRVIYAILFDPSSSSSSSVHDYIKLLSLSIANDYVTLRWATVSTGI
jgi:hypothetical protein